MDNSQNDLIIPTDGVEAETSPNAENIKVKNLVPAGMDQNVGSDTVGVGQPTAQVINQGNSLPPSTVPVKSDFENPANFYDPKADQNLSEARERRETGAAKADLE